MSQRDLVYIYLDHIYKICDIGYCVQCHVNDYPWYVTVYSYACVHCMYILYVSIQHALFKTVCMGRSKVHTYVPLIDIFKMIGSWLSWHWEQKMYLAMNCYLLWLHMYNTFSNNNKPGQIYICITLIVINTHSWLCLALCNIYDIASYISLSMLVLGGGLPKRPRTKLEFLGSLFLQTMTFIK